MMKAKELDSDAREMFSRSSVRARECTIVCGVFTLRGPAAKEVGPLTISCVSDAAGLEASG